MYSRESVMQAYEKTQLLKAACEETGCPPYIAYIWLKKAKMLKPDEAVRYGTKGAKLGAEAEKEFQRLVPKAMPTNGQLEKNCPAFDFDIHGITIDVKYSSVTSAGTWMFQTAKNKKMSPDFFAVFCAETEKGLKGGYKLFLVPAEFVNNYNKASFKPTSRKHFMFEFEVSPRNLAEIFELMAAREKCKSMNEVKK